MNFLKYSLLRLLFSAAAFFASYYFGVGFILAIIFGTLIGFAVCYLAFPRLHNAAAADFNRMIGRGRRKSKPSAAAEDEAVEDAIDETTRNESL